MGFAGRHKFGHSILFMLGVEFPRAHMTTIRDIFKIDLGGRWYVRVLKVCVALIGGWVLVAIVFFVYGFVRGFIHAAH